MKNKKILLTGFLSVFLVLACKEAKEKVEAEKKKLDRLEAELKENLRKSDAKKEEQKKSLFFNNSIDTIIQNFDKKSRENNIAIGKFEKLNFDNRNYYYSKINSREGSNSNYVLDYQGVNVSGMFLKVGVVTGQNLATIENMVVNLIQVSDSAMSDEEAKKIYAQVLSKMDDNGLESSILYSNGVIYSVKITQKTGELVFMAREVEDRSLSQKI